MQPTPIASAALGNRCFSLKAGFSQLKKMLLPAAFLLSFAFFAAPAAAQLSITTTSTQNSYATQVFTVNFPTPETGIDASDFSVVSNGGSTITNITGSGTTYQVYVSSPAVSGTPGTVQLVMWNSGAASPALLGLPVSSPTVQYIPPIIAGGNAQTAAAIVSYTVTFASAITGLSTSNFTVSGSVTGAAVQSITGSGTTYTVYVSIPDSFQSDGQLTLNLANSTNLPAALGGLPVSGQPYTVTLHPRTATVFLTSTNLTNSGYAKTGDQIQYQLTANNYVMSNWNINIGGSTDGGNGAPGYAYGVVTLGAGTPQGPIGYSWNYTDQLNTYGSGSGTSSIIFDSINPSVNISGPSAGVVAGNGASSVSYIVTYADNNLGTTNLNAAGITLNKTGTATGTVALSGVGPSYTVTISNISGEGTLGISVGTGQATDLAGNIDTGAGPSQTVSVQANIQPSISYSGPQAYPINTAISPLAPTMVAGVTTFANTSNSGGMAVDYNGDVFVKDPSNFNLVMYPAGGGTRVTAYSANAVITNAAVAVISPTTSTLLFGITGGHLQSMDYVSGAFQAPATISGAISIPGSSPVAAVHPASGPDVVTLFTDNNSNIYFTARTSGVYTAPAAIANAATTNGLAVNTYQGAVKMAFIGLDNHLYYSTYSGAAWSAVAAWTTPNINISSPSAFALDAQGNAWYCQGTSLYEIINNSSTITTVATLPATCTGIAFDNSGTVYVNVGTLIEKLQVPGGFQVSPGLPSGLSINSVTGVISGTPTAVTPAGVYTITAKAGSTNLTASLNIQTITTPSLSYGSAINATIGTAITPVTASSGSITAQKYNSTPATFASITSPTGLATDPAGNVYASSTSNSIQKYAPGGSLIATMAAPIGPLTGDRTGNVYAGQNTGGVFTFAVYPQGSATGFYTSQRPFGSQTFSTAAGIATDAAGNVYVASSTNNKVYAWANNEYTSGTTQGAMATIIGTGFTSVSGVAADAAGNVYVSDAGAGTIDIIPANRGQWTTLASGLGAPANICIDGGGNLYFSDNVSNTISEIPAGTTTPVLIASGLGSITALAIDGQGNLFAADNTNNVIDKFAPLGGYFINPVLPAGLAFNSSNGTISGTPLATSAAANYTITGYNSLGNATATQNVGVSASLPAVTYANTLTFTTGQAINPVTPVSTGVAAQGYNTNPIFMPAGFGYPYAVAVDTTLKVYVADPWNFANSNLGYSPSGNYNQLVFTKHTNGPFFYTSVTTQVSSIVVDSTGNVYITKNNASFSKLVPGNPYTETAWPGVGILNQAAVDSKGNVFGTQGSQVVQATNGGTTSIASGFNQTFGIAVDGPGNIYVSDIGNNTLYQIPAGSSTPTTVATGFNAPHQLAADGAGNIFIADAGNGAVKELPAGGGSVTTVFPNLKTPTGVAVDIYGSLYVADAGWAQVRKYYPSGGYYISPALPAGLSFNNATGVISGTPTTVTSPKNYKITAYNLSGSTQTTVRIGVAAPSSTLAGLALSSGSLSPAFAGGTISYTVSLPYNTSQIAVTPTTIDPNATIKVNGTTVVSGSASPLINMSVGANAITVVVTASDHSSTKTYTLSLTRAAASAVATLSNVGLTYTTDGSGNPEVIVTPTAAGPGATITVNGSTVTSGSGSSPIALSPGSNTVTIVVTAQNGTTKDTYKITVEGPLSSISTLSNLVISAGTLSPAFSSTTKNYTDNVTNAIPSVTITPTTTDPNATVTVNGATVTSGTASSAIGLNVGNNSIATVVTAQDGVTTTTYTIAVTRAAPPNVNLSALKLSTGTLSPAFAAATTSYTAAVANTVTSVTLTPTLSDPTASVTVNGTPVTSGAASAAIPLNLGANTITTIVTAHDGVSTKTYTLTLTRTPSSNALLASIATTPVATLVGTTGTGYLNFNAAVPNSTASIQVVPTAKDATATITVNGMAVTSGAASQAITLPVGQTVITTVITAQDGITTKSIIITVTRAPSSNATLSNIALSSGTLSPAFVSTTTTYGASVNDIGSVMFTPTTADAGATLTVNGTAATSGTGVPITLVKGANTITTVVTAQDGTTKKTYTTVVTLVPGTNAQIATIATNPTISLVGTTGAGYLNFKSSVPNSISSIQEIVTLKDPLATMTVNGTPTTSGAASQLIALPVGQTVITTVITAQDGVTQKTVILTITRAPSSNATLSNIALSSGTLTPAFVTSTTSYKASVTDIGSVTITPTTADPTATLTVNGTAATSGTPVTVTLVNGANTINTVVTAQDGVTTKTYATVVTLTPGTNAQIATIATTPTVSLVGTTGTGYLNFKASVPNSFSSIQEIVTLKDPLATMTVNGTAATSGSPSQAIALAVGATTITTVITAQDGVTQKTVMVTITRAAPPVNKSLDQAVLSMNKPVENIPLNDDGIFVHQALSPNGDGVNDVLTIDNITCYPDNHLTIVDRNGNMVYEVKGYNNAAKLFDGHAANGKMQLPGTYFYSLDYTANGESKHKTGYIILKY